MYGRLICTALLNFVKIEEFIFMILSHLAFRNYLTTSRCMVISTIYVVYLDTYTLETKMSGSLLFLALKWPFFIRTWPSGISISCHFGQKYFMGLSRIDHFRAKTSKYPKHFALQCRAAIATIPLFAIDILLFWSRTS